ncbi:MAG TPA: hypothetical protein VNR11_05720 [Xanthobacteraceae bacterium]|nr:hypothetical protein [Xanthobacteraceae bacterium]
METILHSIRVAGQPRGQRSSVSDLLHRIARFRPVLQHRHGDIVARAQARWQALSAIGGELYVPICIQ